MFVCLFFFQSYYSGITFGDPFKNQLHAADFSCFDGNLDFYRFFLLYQNNVKTKRKLQPHIGRVGGGGVWLLFYSRETGELMLEGKEKKKGK